MSKKFKVDEISPEQFLDVLSKLPDKDKKDLIKRVPHEQRVELLRLFHEVEDQEKAHGNEVIDQKE